MVDRRAFLKASVAANVFGFSLTHALEAFAGPTTDIAGMLNTAGTSSDDEDFWNMIRKDFLFKEGTIFLNNGTVGPSPRMVIDTVVEHMRKFNDMFSAGHAKIPPIKEGLANLVGCNAGEIAITRNTTESISFIANGLDWNTGDEILLTDDQEHIGGKSGWQLAAKRHNLSIKEFHVSMPPKDENEILNAINDSITDRTKLVMVSHVTFTNGLRFPVKEIGKLCKDKGILFCVDGAHPVGMLKFNMYDLNCDFYASSTHKWLLAPKGTGVLFIKDDMIDRVWTTVASGWWDNTDARAGRLDNFGTINDSILEGLGAAVRYNEIIGQERIERRIFDLITYFKEQVIKIPKITLRTPMDNSFSSGMASFNIDGVKGADAQRIMMQNDPRIRTRLIAEYDHDMIRVSTHIFNTREEIDIALGVIEEIARGKSQ